MDTKTKTSRHSHGHWVGRVDTRVAQELQLNLGSLNPPCSAFHWCLSGGTFSCCLLQHLMDLPAGPLERKSKPLWSWETMQTCLIQAEAPAWRRGPPGLGRTALRLSGLLPSPHPHHSETLGPYTFYEGERQPQPPRVSAQGTQHASPSPLNTVVLFHVPDFCRTQYGPIRHGAKRQSPA